MGNDCLSSADGVDFRKNGHILADGRPDPAYFSHKFRGPALRYEVALSIRSSDIVWIAGPYLPGEWNDLQIFRHGLRGQLEDGERIEADDGYAADAPVYVKCPSSVAVRDDQKRLRARVRMRHESINKRLCAFGALQNRWRHGIELHGATVRACCILVQLAMEGGEHLFDCREYYDELSDQDISHIFGYGEPL